MRSSAASACRLSVSCGAITRTETEGSAARSPLTLRSATVPPPTTTMSRPLRSRFTGYSKETPPKYESYSRSLLYRKWAQKKRGEDRIPSLYSDYQRAVSASRSTCRIPQATDSPSYPCRRASRRSARAPRHRCPCPRPYPYRTPRPPPGSARVRSPQCARTH